MGRIESSDIAKAFVMAARGMDLHAAWVKCGQPGTWGNVHVGRGRAVVRRVRRVADAPHPVH